jgi:hypothetical protein
MWTRRGRQRAGERIVTPYRFGRELDAWGLMLITTSRAVWSVGSDAWSAASSSMKGMIGKRAILNLAEVAIDFRKSRFNSIFQLSPTTMTTGYEEIKDFAYELAERVCPTLVQSLWDRLPRSFWRVQLLDGLIPIMPKLRRIRLMWAPLIKLIE